MRSPWSPLVLAAVAFLFVGSVPLGSGHVPGGAPAPPPSGIPSIARSPGSAAAPATSPSWSVAQTLVLFNNTTEQGNFPAVNGASANDVAFDNATNELFLTDPTQNVVSVFSTVSDELVATVPVADPQGVVYDPGTGQAFVTSSVPYPGAGPSP